jgi:ABC-type sugar transport system substrate-binding protein
VRVLLPGRLKANFVVGVALLVAAAVPAAAVPAAAAATALRSPRVHLAAATRPVDKLDAVAVVSPSDAWAVGTYQASGWAHTLIEHWNGPPGR